MAKEVVDGKQIDKKLKSRNPVIAFDKLRLFFNEPYVIDIEGCDGVIKLVQPTIGDIIRLGEKRFYATLNVFATNTTAFRLQLWEQGKDWNTISDFELFYMIVGSAEKEIYQTFLPDIDFSNFSICKKHKPDSDEQITVLYDLVNKIEINEEVYFHLSQYLRNVFNIFPEEKITDDAILKKWYIEKDKRELKIREEKKEKGELDEDSNLMPIISGCVNHPGFKYKTSELKEIGVYEFWDSVKRLQVYESTTALQKGMYSGFMDTKNIKPEDYNFMRVI